MSSPVNEHEVSSIDPPRSPPNSRHTRAIIPDNNRTETNSRPENPTNTSRVSTATNSPITDRPSRSRDHPLQEFRSLLEAAQRIADSTPFVTDGDRWREDDQPEPIIYLNRRRTGHLPPRRVPLTRQYSGRPHVPGEDSGSEGSVDADEMDLEQNNRPQREGVNNDSNPSSGSTQGIAGNNLDIWPLDQAGSTTDTTTRARADHVRTRDGQQEEEEREILEQALARNRQVRSRFESDNQRSHLAGTPASRYSTTGPSPTRESFYDWAPDASASADALLSTTLSRSRAASIRRWRPAERLQDYASNHARRDSGGVAQASVPSILETAPHPPPATTAIPATTRSSIADLPEYPVTTPVPATGPGSHDDVVDRVERALQQYRLARRALRTQNWDSTTRNPADSDRAQNTLEHAISNRASFASLEPPDAISAIRTTANDPGSDTSAFNRYHRRTLPSVLGHADTTSSSTATRSADTGRDGRQDPLRQRIREQVRERRRHVLQSWSQENTRESLARGPLFESTIASQNIRVQADPRRALEKIRLDESRARSAELKRAKAALQYLARLRDREMNQVKAWTVASELGLHNQSLEEDPKTALPMSLKSLPMPTFSSWLEPGMTWSGIQDANDAGDKPAQPVHEAFLDPSLAREQQERVDVASRQYESFRSRIGSARDPLERTFLGNGDNDPLRAARNSMQILEDAERSLSSMLERSEELLRENERQLRDNEEQLRQNRERLRDTDRRLTLLDEAVRQRARQRAARSVPTLPSRLIVNDWWNVKVTLHSVDEEQMVVSGTMTASHQTVQSPSTASSNLRTKNDEEDPAGTSMDSFFIGDIVDFKHHGLDTPLSLSNSGNPSNSTSFRQQDEWDVGGPETDLCYWAGIGPFKHEIERALKTAEAQNDLNRATHFEDKQLDQDVASEERLHTIGPNSESTGDNTDKPLSMSASQDVSITVPLSEDEKFAVKMDTMASLLSDATWLSENIGAKGWILMRWKERCFVAPGTDPNPDARRPWIPNQSQTSTFDDGNPWYFHDPGTNTLRRRGERDNRVWSTNAEEREELTSSQGLSSTVRQGGTTDSGGGSIRPPTWGLTISGFYYVALERKTGHIEALYYDCGSTPFQRLKMNPKTLYGSAVSSAAASRSQQRVASAQDIKMTTEIDDMSEYSGMDDTTHMKPVDLSGITGLKTNFNIVEFR